MTRKNERQLTVHAVTRLNWRDDRLQWDSEEYNHYIGAIIYPMSKVWVPYVIPQYFKELPVYMADNKVLFRENGAMLLEQQAKFTTTCDVTELENDGTVTCYLEFVSRDYFLGDVDLHADVPLLLTEDVPPGAIHRPSNVTVYRKEFHYATGSVVKLIYAITIIKAEVKSKRAAEEVAVLPIVLLGLMAPLQFLIPLNSPGRLAIDGALILCAGILSVRVYAVDHAYPPSFATVSYENFVLLTIFSSVLFTIINFHICCSNGLGCINLLGSCKRNLYPGVSRLLCVARPKSREMGVKPPRDAKDVEERDLDVMDGDDKQGPTTLIPPETEEQCYNHQLTDITNILVSLAEEHNRREIDVWVKDDWLAIGLIVDRLFFISFLLVFVFSSVGLIYQ